MHTTSRLLAAFALLPALGAMAPAAHAAALALTVEVDTRVCASVPVQCAGAGHTFAAASGSNHNPIALRVSVVNKNGLPVNGLNAANFTFTNGIVPAGGGAAVECTVATCGASTFANAGPGIYQIFLDRGPAGNWTPGGYAAALQVSAGVNNGTKLVAFDIPN
jgi:hypothetical protein